MAPLTTSQDSIAPGKVRRRRSTSLVKRIESASNVLIGALLRSPLHRLMSGTVVLVEYRGRKSDKRYATPVSYFRQGDTLIFFTAGKWWHNFRGGAPVTVLLKGTRFPATAEASPEDRNAACEAMSRAVKDNWGMAKYYGVRFNTGGEPLRESLEHAVEKFVMVKVSLAPGQAR